MIAEIVLICPCCGQAVYGTSSQREFTCPRCEQKWSMEVDLSRIERHSLL